MIGHMVFQGWRKNLIGLSALAGVSLLIGCASTSTESGASSKLPPLPAGVTLHQDKDIQGVWLADGFDFKGCDTLYIAPPAFAAIERTNEVQMRAMAMRLLPQQLVEHLRDTKLFTTVTDQADVVKPDAKKLSIQSTIIEYEKGGGGARYFAGMFGGGQPVIKVRGVVTEGDKVLCVCELRRSGESAGSRMGGVFMSDEEIQRNDIRDLASDLADFVKRTAKVQ
jgi:hypothetical protein